MNQPVTRVGFEEYSGLHVVTWRQPTGEYSVSFMESDESWIAAKDGLNLRQWA